MPSTSTASPVRVTSVTLPDKSFPSSSSPTPLQRPRSALASSSPSSVTAKLSSPTKWTSSNGEHRPQLLPLPSLAHSAFSARERCNHVFLWPPHVERSRQPLLRRQRVSLFPSRTWRRPQTPLPPCQRACVSADYLSVGYAWRDAKQHRHRQLCHRLGLSAGPAILRDGYRRHFCWLSHPRLLHRLYGPRRWLLPLFWLPQSLPLRHAHSRSRQQSFASLRRMGSGRALQLLAHRFLFSEKIRIQPGAKI